MVVYTGLLPVTQNETAMAIVMGHEIAHSIAKHGNERMSQALVQQMGGMALEIALAQKPQETQDLFMATYGIGSQLGAMLPWSRQQETEADKLKGIDKDDDQTDYEKRPQLARGHDGIQDEEGRIEHHAENQGEPDPVPELVFLVVSV